MTRAKVSSLMASVLFSVVLFSAVLLSALPARPAEPLALTDGTGLGPTFSGLTPELREVLAKITINPDIIDFSMPKLEARAAAGSADAMFRLGEAYLYGKDAPVDVAKAHSLIDQALALTKAHATDEPGGFVCAGVCELFFEAQPWELPVGDAYYFEGPDPAALRAHAQARDALAMKRLGDAYAKGRLYWALKADPVQADYWYRRAASAGNKEALLELGRLHGDSSEALDWYKRAVSAHVDGAHVDLAGYYQHRRHPGDDKLAAAQWLNAARKGDTNAMEEMSRRYAAGDGVRKDAKAARTWCERAVRELSTSLSYPAGNVGFSLSRPARQPDCAARLLD